MTLTLHCRGNVIEDEINQLCAIMGGNWIVSSTVVSFAEVKVKTIECVVQFRFDTSNLQRIFAWSRIVSFYVRRSSLCIRGNNT